MHGEDGEGSESTNFCSEGNKTGLPYFRTVTVYSLAIEPLLCRLTVVGVSLPGLSSLCSSIIVSYADDLTVFVTCHRDV